jgi:hypothetical protein
MAMLYGMALMHPESFPLALKKELTSAAQLVLKMYKLAFDIHLKQNFPMNCLLDIKNM